MEYIPLETNDDFLCQGFLQDIGKDIIVVKNFDRENLICFDNFVSNDGKANDQAFMLVSKQDGSIAKEIKIPFKEKKLTAVIMLVKHLRVLRHLRSLIQT